MKLRHNFKNLKIWQKSVDLAVKVYEITKSFPVKERFGITSQMRRSSVGIPSTIAEGSARNSTKAFSNCLDISLGESFELETQAIISQRAGILEEEDFETLSRDLSGVQKMIIGFQSSLESTPS